MGDRWPEREYRRYRVEMRGNNFVKTGGDAAKVTGAFFGAAREMRGNNFGDAGAFFGAAHEGMGGVIVRDDLSAGFGGTR